MTEIDSVKFEIFQAMGERNFRKAVISAPFYHTAKYKKIRLERKIHKGNFFYQFELYCEDQVFHKNYTDMLDVHKQIEEYLQTGYKQWDMGIFKIIMNKKRNWKKTDVLKPSSMLDNLNLSGHNKVKNYIFQEGSPIQWMIALGIMNGEGSVRKEKQKKFQQINRFVEIVSDVVDELPPKPCIVDFGCGKSYLTFALYDYLCQRRKEPTIIGLDLKADVVQECQNLARQVSFQNLYFQVGDIRSYASEVERIDMVVSLHACDTATDYAMYHAVQWRVKALLSVPCCQHELMRQVQNDGMDGFFKYGVMKERFSSLLTDSMRTLLLESKGYQSKILEFIDSSHTPKNLMIKAIRDDSKKGWNEKAFSQYQKLAQMYAVHPTLFRLFDL